MKIDKEFVEICKKLNECGVKYVVCGGYAVKLYGIEKIAKQERKTMDYDFIVDSSEENIKRIKKALQEFSSEIKELKNNDLEKYNTVMIVSGNKKYLDVDLVSNVWNVDYEKAQEDMITQEINGVEIPVVSIDRLIEMKEKSNRARDITDTFYLKKLKK